MRIGVSTIFSRSTLAKAITLALGVVGAIGVSSTPTHAAREANPLTANDVVKKVSVEQKLGDQVPLELPFKDETGADVKLGDYFQSNKPVVLSLVYYECPGLCTMTLNGINSSFKALGTAPSGKAFEIGREFEVVTVSFNPADTPELAAKKKKSYVGQYGRPGAEKGWHFLTGNAESIKALTDAVGFHYQYDPATRQFAHASAIMVVTPNGKLARYFYGLEYSSRDLRLGLIEAANERIGTLSDAIILLCYQYDPHSGKYSWAVMRTVQLGGLVTVLAVGSYVGLMLRRERRKAATVASSPAGAFPVGPERQDQK